MSNKNNNLKIELKKYSMNRNEKGITLIALMSMIIILLILASITIYTGGDTIKKAKLESLKTNMLLIRAKTREYVEDVSHQIGTKPEERTDDEKSNIRNSVYGNAGLKEYSSGASYNVPSSIINDGGESNLYIIDGDCLKNMGLSQVNLDDGECYLVRFDESNVDVKVYNNIGFQEKYSFDEIENMEI